MYHLLLTFSPFILLRISVSPVCYAFWQPFKSKGFEWEQNESICPNFVNLSTLLHRIVENPLPRSEETMFLVWALAVTNELGPKQQCGFWKARSFLWKPLSCHWLLSCLSHVPLSLKDTWWESGKDTPQRGTKNTVSWSPSCKCKEEKWGTEEVRGDDDTVNTEIGKKLYHGD